MNGIQHRSSGVKKDIGRLDGEVLTVALSNEGPANSQAAETNAHRPGPSCPDI